MYWEYVLSCNSNYIFLQSRSNYFNMSQRTECNFVYSNSKTFTYYMTLDLHMVRQMLDWLQYLATAEVLLPEHVTPLRSVQLSLILNCQTSHIQSPQVKVQVITVPKMSPTYGHCQPSSLEDGVSMFLWNVCIYLQVYTVSQFRTSSSLVALHF
jgi:hypothetical protein